ERLRDPVGSFAQRWTRSQRRDIARDDGLGQLLGLGETYHDLIYQRPGFSEDARVFCDLASYAPGLNTAAADIRAVLETEARPAPGGTPGRIEPRAQALIDKARARSWQSLRSGGSGIRSFQIVFDGSGRYVCERLLPFGLREQVVCDGTALLHLYP